MSIRLVLLYAFIHQYKTSKSEHTGKNHSEACKSKKTAKNLNCEFVPDFASEMFFYPIINDQKAMIQTDATVFLITNSHFYEPKSVLDELFSDAFQENHEMQLIFFLFYSSFDDKNNKEEYKKSFESSVINLFLDFNTNIEEILTDLVNKYIENCKSEFINIVESAYSEKKELINIICAVNFTFHGFAGNLEGYLAKLRDKIQNNHLEEAEWIDDLSLISKIIGIYTLLCPTFKYLAEEKLFFDKMLKPFLDFFMRKKGFQPLQLDCKHNLKSVNVISMEEVNYYNDVDLSLKIEEITNIIRKNLNDNIYFCFLFDVNKFCKDNLKLCGTIDRFFISDDEGIFEVLVKMQTFQLKSFLLYSKKLLDCLKAFLYKNNPSESLKKQLINVKEILKIKKHTYLFQSNAKGFLGKLNDYFRASNKGSTLYKVCIKLRIIFNKINEIMCEIMNEVFSQDEKRPDDFDKLHKDAKKRKICEKNQN